MTNKTTKLKIVSKKSPRKSTQYSPDEVDYGREFLVRFLNAIIVSVCYTYDTIGFVLFSFLGLTAMLSQWTGIGLVLTILAAAVGVYSLSSSAKLYHPFYVWQNITRPFSNYGLLYAFSVFIFGHRGGDVWAPIFLLANILALYEGYKTRELARWVRKHPEILKDLD